MVPARSAGEGDSSEERLRAKLRRELGPILLGELENPATEDLMLNPDGGLWVKRAGERFSYLGQFSSTQAMGLIATIASHRRMVVNQENPILEAELPLDGSRFEGLIPPIVSGPAFAIRKKAIRVFTLEEYESAGILTYKDDPLNKLKRVDSFLEGIRGKSHGEVVRSAVRERKNILLVGSTGAGKTTLINAVLDNLAKQAPMDRVLLIEDTPELQCTVKNFVALLAPALGKITMLDCLRACMRLRPTRILVGEVRDGAALTLLKTWGTGHPGGAASIHADDAMGGLVRLEALVGEATSAPQQRLIAEAVDVVVFIDEEPSLAAGRKVKEVCVVTGYKEGKYVVEYV